MSISFLIILSVILAAPWESRRIFYEAFRAERRQIAVDNAAIVIGRRDRELFRFLSASNRLLRGMEVAHHALHACARTPQGAAVCMDKDVAIELQIELVLRTTYETASVWWKSAAIAAESSARRLDEEVSLIRPASPPLRKYVCPICGRAVQWEVESGNRAIQTIVRDRFDGRFAARVRPYGISLRDGATWDYLLEEEVGLGGLGWSTSKRY